MIYDSLANLHTYIALHPLFGNVLEFINKENIAALEKGKVNLSGGVYAVVDEYETQDMKDTFIECHKTYIDIQVIMEGMEQIGICNKNEAKIIEGYNKESDLEKLDGQFDLITLRKGYFVIFYPQDGHAPGLRINNKKDKVKKIVFKIPR
jgi:YhcH/YjgK/YiaL family protein